MGPRTSTDAGSRHRDRIALAAPPAGPRCRLQCRGGMVFAIQHELGLPILFAGLGERPEDLIPFDPDAFVRGILGQ